MQPEIWSMGLLQQWHSIQEQITHTWTHGLPQQSGWQNDDVVKKLINVLRWAKIVTSCSAESPQILTRQQLQTGNQTTGPKLKSKSLLCLVWLTGSSCLSAYWSGFPFQFYLFGPPGITTIKLMCFPCSSIINTQVFLQLIVVCLYDTSLDHILTMVFFVGPFMSL